MSSVRDSTWLCAVILVSMSACAEDHVLSIDAAIRDAATVDDAEIDAATVDAAAVDAAAVVGPCPPALPAVDSACTREGLVCEYGSRICTSIAECEGGTWRVAVPRCPPPPSGCPTTRASAEGSACAGLEGSRCEVEDALLCTCTSCPMPFPVCMIADPPVWACEAPNADPSCPASQPLLGTACAAEGRTCDYGCETGRRRICSGGGWVAGSQPGGCPL